MTTFQPAYRLIVYKARSEDSTETGVLVPAVGASHSDEFAASSIDGLRENLVVNPQLDTSLSYWSGIGYGDVVTRDTNPSVGLPFGSAVAKCVTSTGVLGTEGFLITYIGGGIQDVVANTTYTFSAFVEMTSMVGVDYILLVRWYTSGGVFISDAPTATFTGTSGWTRVSTTATAPATAAKVDFMIRESSVSATSYTIYATGVQIEEASSIGQYNKYPFSFKPYLDLPKGRKGRIDPLKGKYDSPQMSFDILDKRVTGYSDNFHRWMTTFLGDALGRLKMVGRRVSVEESLDGGATWSAYFAGRISDFSLNGALKFTIVCRESMSELNQTLFDNQPVSGAIASIPQLLPIGMTDNYGIIKGANTALSGAIQNTNDVQWVPGGLTGGSPFANWTLPRQYGNKNVCVFRVSTKSQHLSDNIASANLQQYLGTSRWKNIHALAGLTLDTGSVPFNIPVQIRSSSLQPWQTFRAVAMTYDKGFFAAFTHESDVPRIVDIYFTPQIAYSGSRHPQLSGLSTGSSQAGYQVRVLPPNHDTITENNPVIIPPSRWISTSMQTPIHPATVLQQAVSGAYSLLNPNGTLLRTIPIRATSSYAGDQQNIAYLLTQPYPSIAAIITAPMKLSDFLDKYITPVGIGYRFEAEYSGTTVQSVMVPFDNRLPSTLPSVRITDDDLAHATNVQWSVGTPFPYARATAYLDVGFTYNTKTLTSDGFPSIVPTKIKSYPIKFFSLERISDGDALDTYDNTPMALDLPSLRLQRISTDEDTSDQLESYITGSARPQFDSHVWRIIDHYENRFASGPPTITLKCRRTALINNIKVGQWVEVDVDVLPDQATHLRGGIRLMQVTEKSEDGLSVTLGLIDGGPNARLVAPTIGPMSGSGFSRVDVPVTLPTGSVRLVLDVAIVPTGSSQPAEDSPLWRQSYNVVKYNSGSFTQSLAVGKASSSVFVRGQVQSIGRTPTFRVGIDTPPVIAIPSTWSYTSKHYGCTTLSAPTGLAYSISGQYVTLQWTGSSDNMQSMVTVSAPTSSTAVIARVLDSLTDVVTIGPYPPSVNPIRASVYQIDGQGGLSVSQSVVLYTSASNSDVNSTPTPLNVEFITLN